MINNQQSYFHQWGAYSHHSLAGPPLAVNTYIKYWDTCTCTPIVFAIYSNKAIIVIIEQTVTVLTTCLIYTLITMLIVLYFAKFPVNHLHR